MRTAIKKPSEEGDEVDRFLELILALVDSSTHTVAEGLGRLVSENDILNGSEIVLYPSSFFKGYSCNDNCVKHAALKLLENRYAKNDTLVDWFKIWGISNDQALKSLKHHGKIDLKALRTLDKEIVKDYLSDVPDSEGVTEILAEKRKLWIVSKADFNSRGPF
jgi:hypothetical protein